MKILLFKLLSFLVLFNKIHGDICDRSCKCVPKEDPIEVYCTNASIHIIPQDLPPYIEFLDLRDNAILLIESTLSHYEELISLDLSQNLINTIRPRAFSRLGSLNRLDLSRNQLSKLNALDFKGLTGLKSLSLKGNQITELHEKVFSTSILFLEHLDLSSNQIYTFSRNVFHGLKKLKSLDLSHNRLTSLSFLRNLNLPILQNLILDGNNFGQIREVSPFNHFQSLEFLSLVGCRLSEQSSDFFTGLSGLKELDLMDNLIETLPFKSLYNDDLKGLSILRVGSIIFRELNSGIGCLEGLTELSISGCINSLPFHFEKNSLHNNTKLKGVNFTSCSGLDHLPDGAFMDLPHFEYLHLRGNALQSISPRIADWNSLNSVDLELNPFKCDCSMSWIFELPGYDHFQSLIQTASCKDGDSLSHSKFLHCEKSVYSGHFLTIILVSVAGVLSLIALIILGFWIFHQRKKKGSVSRFRRRKFGKINKHEISVIPERVSNPAGYKDVLTEESLPLGRNLSNFPDVKTSVL